MPLNAKEKLIWYAVGEIHNLLYAYQHCHWWQFNKRADLKEKMNEAIYSVEDILVPDGPTDDWELLDHNLSVLKKARRVRDAFG